MPKLLKIIFICAIFIKFYPVYSAVESIEYAALTHKQALEEENYQILLGDVLIESESGGNIRLNEKCRIYWDESDLLNELAEPIFSDLWNIEKIENLRQILQGARENVLQWRLLSSNSNLLLLIKALINTKRCTNGDKKDDLSKLSPIPTITFPTKFFPLIPPEELGITTDEDWGLRAPAVSIFNKELSLFAESKNLDIDGYLVCPTFETRKQGIAIINSVPILESKLDLDRAWTIPLHEIGHYLGLDHTFLSIDSQRKEVQTMIIDNKSIKFNSEICLMIEKKFGDKIDNSDHLLSDLELKSKHPITISSLEKLKNYSIKTIARSCCLNKYKNNEFMDFDFSSSKSKVGDTIPVFDKNLTNGSMCNKMTEGLSEKIFQNPVNNLMSYSNSINHKITNDQLSVVIDRIKDINSSKCTLEIFK